MALDTRNRIEDALAESGVHMSVDRFVELVATALRAISRERRLTGDVTSLTVAEIDELERGGLQPRASLSDYETARARTAAHTAAMFAASLPTSAVAARLGVDQSRVRQMLGERSLLGFKDGNEWRVLEFQFADDAHLVPNIRQVVRALPAELALSAVANWLETPEPDLELGGEPVSPWRWLTEGGAVEPVVALAADL